MASATNGYKRLHGLTVEQQNAIELLVMGESDAAAAEQVGVHRTTITRWRLYDVVFQAAVNRRRREIWSTSTDRLRSLLPIALDALEAELQQPGRQRSRVAIEICRLAGLESGAFKGQSLGVEGVGESDPDAIVDRLALARRIDPFDAMPNGGPVNDLERDAVVSDLNARLKNPGE